MSAASTATDDAWMAEAKCRGAAYALFFPEKEAGTWTTVRAAKAICVTCPVRVACLEYALAHNEVYGVWGGTSDPERRRIKRARRIAASRLERAREA